MATYPNFSKWVQHCPIDTKCTNSTCKAAIPEGSLCVQHKDTVVGSSAAYGCPKCAIKHWTDDLIPAEWVVGLSYDIETPMVVKPMKPKNAFELVFPTDYPTDHPGWYWVSWSGYTEWVCCGSINGNGVGCDNVIPDNSIVAIHLNDKHMPPKGWINCPSCAQKAGHGAVPVELQIGSKLEVSGLTATVLPSGPKKIISFGMKYGPLEKDILFKSYVVDIRKKVRNPWKDKTLRKLTGTDSKILEFVSRCTGAQKILDYWTTFLPSSGFKSIAFSCHAGKHRSVAVAELLAKRLTEKGFEVELIHRDLNRVK